MMIDFDICRHQRLYVTLCLLIADDRLYQALACAVNRPFDLRAYFNLVLTSHDFAFRACLTADAKDRVYNGFVDLFII